MQSTSLAEKSPAEEPVLQNQAISNPSPAIEIGLLTGCQDLPYAFGLAMALISKGVRLDIIGSDEIDSPELHATPNLRFLNFRGNQRNQENFAKKLARLLDYYVKLMRYAGRTKPKIFHILWNNKFEYFDRTLLMLYYRLLGKQVVFTVHNVNANKRDLKDTRLNRLTLRIQYRLTHHIFVHTEKMKHELIEEFGVQSGRVTI